MSRYPGRILSSTTPTVNANSAKGIWTLDEALRYQRAGTWPVPTGGGDPYFGYNTLLLPGQGTDLANNNTFQDSSSNNLTVYRNGNPTQGTFTPFSEAPGYWSNYFGTSAHFLSVANNAALNLSGGAYTIEGWVYPNGNYSTFNVLISKRVSGGTASSAWQVFLNTSTGVLAFYNGTQYNSTATPPSNQWSHFAAVYNGTELSLYLNGVRVLNPTAITNTDYSVNPVIGSYSAGGPYEQLFGYLSNVRITKGAALYTGATYTVPTGPLTTTVSSGTVSLLTCQSNRFIDNSVNAAAITATGSPSVQTFQPFGAPTSAYSAATIGGSGYFDGTGDYLTVLDNASLEPGSSDFTIECWIYPTATGSFLGLFSKRTNNSTDYSPIQILINSGTMILAASTSGSSWAVNVNASSSPPLNAWSHIAVVRNGTGSNNLVLYLNGVSVATGSVSSTALVNNAGAWAIAADSDDGGGNFAGYICGFRSVIGTAVYTAAFTPPTAPLTAITNTSLLLNYTNAGIIDNALSNDLETAGTASISTTQYKWGASSIYFDGNGDYLIQKDTPNLAFGTGEFTIEMWLYRSVSGAQHDIIAFNPTTTNGAYPSLYISSGNVLFYYTQSANQITGPTINTGQWYHVALSRSGRSTKLFVDGNQVGSTYADTNSYLCGTDRPIIGSGGYTVNGTYNGYIADLRITKGLGRYQYNFNRPSAAFPLFYQAAATPSSDPYFQNTTLLLPGNGTINANNNTFLDSSGNGLHPNRSGNVTQGTFTPFSKVDGRWGNYFDGVDDYISAPSVSLGTGNFTFEAWQYILPDGADYGRICGMGDFLNSTGLGIGFNPSTSKFEVNNNNSTIITSSSSYSYYTWHHVALVRSGSNVTLYVNGTSAGTTTNSNSLSGIVYISAIRYNGTNYFGASYTSNFRLTNTAVYTGAFTPSTSPLTAISGTQVLTCQSNRFIDNSTNAYTITIGGAPLIQTFSPFPTLTAYDASVNGGSGYFDGTADFLSVTNNAAFNFGSGAFTIEFWYYPTTLSGTQCLITNYGSSTTGFVIQMGGSTAGSGKIDAGFSGDGADITSTNGLTANTWNHIAISGTPGATGIKLFVNGTQTGSTYTGATSLDTSSTLLIGEVASTNRLSGYLCGLRLLKGTAQYTTTFTPPTTPPTAIANTSLLCNFTNGGIIDNTMSNDLETFDGASISTTQSKWGGSSMFFDGSGDYLIMPNVLTGQFRTGDFTIEYWDFHGTQGTNYANQVGTLSSTTPAGTWRFGTFTNLGGLYFAYHNGSAYVDVTFGSTLYNDSTWRHFAISRYNGVLYAFVNGFLVGTPTACTQDFNSNNRVVLGAELNNPTYFTGYLQDVRITRGVARYVQNFTPPTQAFLTL